MTSRPSLELSERQVSAKRIFDLDAVKPYFPEVELLELLTVFDFRLPMSQPQPRRIFTTLGVTAAVRGIRMKMNDLWIA